MSVLESHTYPGVSWKYIIVVMFIKSNLSGILKKEVYLTVF